MSSWVYGWVYRCMRCLRTVAIMGREMEGRLSVRYVSEYDG